MFFFLKTTTSTVFNFNIIKESALNVIVAIWSSVAFGCWNRVEVLKEERKRERLVSFEEECFSFLGLGSVVSSVLAYGTRTLLNIVLQ